jgi:hypothetical protein
MIYKIGFLNGCSIEVDLEEGAYDHLISLIPGEGIKNINHSMLTLKVEEIMYISPSIQTPKTTRLEEDGYYYNLSLKKVLESMGIKGRRTSKLYSKLREDGILVKNPEGYHQLVEGEAEGLLKDMKTKDGNIPVVTKEGLDWVKKLINELY